MTITWQPVDTYDLGDTAQFDLALTVKVGNTVVPIEADEVTLTITDPLGVESSATPIIHTPGQNTYAFRKVVDQIGTWQARWLATGDYNGQPYTQSEPNQLFVRPDGPRIVSLAEVKAALHISSNTYDGRLRGMIDAAAENIELYTGPVLPRTITRAWPNGFLRAGWYLLGEWPVARIVSHNGAPTTAEDLALTGEGWVMLPADTTELVWIAGREPVPQTLREAALELVMHWWQGSSQFSMASPAQVLPSDDYDARSTLPGQSYGMPYRVLDKIRPYMRVRVA